MKKFRARKPKKLEFRSQTTPPSVVLALPRGLIVVHAHDCFSSYGLRFIENRQVLAKLHDVEKIPVNQNFLARTCSFLSEVSLKY